MKFIMDKYAADSDAIMSGTNGKAAKTATTSTVATSNETMFLFPKV